MPASGGVPRVSPRESREGIPVLVVDDDPLTLRMVRDALAAVGYSPFVTGDPQEVSRLIKTKKPQLVLLDLMLPGTDGIELMEQVPEMADLPVIFISGYGRDETIARALQKGAADYIVKPFSPTELAARVQAVLRRVAAPPRPFRLGGSGDRLRGTTGDVSRESVGVDGHRIRSAPGPFGQRGTGRHLRVTAAPGVEQAAARRPSTGSHLCEEAAPEAWT